jgi:hypothetical protein
MAVFLCKLVDCAVDELLPLRAIAAPYHNNPTCLTGPPT